MKIYKLKGKKLNIDVLKKDIPNIWFNYENDHHIYKYLIVTITILFYR